MIDEELGTREGHHVSHAPESTVKHSIWGTSVLFTVVTAVIFGLGYPLLLTGLAHIFFPRQAAGSLITRNGQVIGSELIAQSFTSDKYFHPRPSAAGNGYDATSSGGTNLAQSNAKLPQRMQADIDKLAAPKIRASLFPSMRSRIQRRVSIRTSRPTMPTSRRRASPRRAGCRRMRFAS